MLREDAAEFCHMWDGSEDWVLVKYHLERIALTVHFVGQSPNIQEIIALRKLLPEYQHLPPGKVREIIGAGNTHELPTMPGSEARLIAERGKQMGLMISEKDASYRGYSPISRTGDSVQLGGPIIDDEDLAQEIASRMLEAGVPVYEDYTLLIEESTPS